MSPYYTYAAFGDKWVEMAWCHDAITHALHFWASVYGKRISVEELLDRTNEPDVIQALCFGAIRARSPINIDSFEKLYEHTAGVYAVSIGLNGYLPTVRKQEQFGELDESYPEVIQIQKKEELDMGPAYRALRRLGYSCDEIGRMTWDGMAGALGTDKEDDRWELPWLESGTTD